MCQTRSSGCDDASWTRPGQKAELYRYRGRVVQARRRQRKQQTDILPLGPDMSLFHDCSTNLVCKYQMLAERMAGLGWRPRQLLVVKGSDSNLRLAADFQKNRQYQCKLMALKGLEGSLQKELLYNRYIQSLVDQSLIPTSSAHHPASVSHYNLLRRSARSSFLNSVLLSGYGSNTTEFKGLSSLARWNMSS